MISSLTANDVDALLASNGEVSVAAGRAVDADDAEPAVDDAAIVFRCGIFAGKWNEGRVSDESVELRIMRPARSQPGKQGAASFTGTKCSHRVI